jgi:hypothetical protein
LFVALPEPITASTEETTLLPNIGTEPNDVPTFLEYIHIVSDQRSTKVYILDVACVHVRTTFDTFRFFFTRFLIMQSIISGGTKDLRKKRLEDYSLLKVT